VTEPRRSRDHTERLLTRVGVSVVSHPVVEGWRVELRDPPDRLDPLDFTVPGDFSSAAFLITLAALGGVEGGELTVEGVGLNPTRTAFLDVLRRMGVPLEVRVTSVEGDSEPVGDVSVAAARLVGTTVSSGEVPSLIDELPLVAVLGARASGRTVVTGAEELRAKESDRIRAMVSNLHAVGVQVEEFDDGMAIEGADGPLAGAVEAFGDHRIAMAMGVLGSSDSCNIEVRDRDVAGVSFPGFWDLLADLGGDVAR
jgi:3-phosphoshikimate 1-carboxyvinyltransferase